MDRPPPLIPGADTASAALRPDVRSRLRTRALGPLAVGWVALALAAAAGLFWHQDLRYSLATPIPDGLVVPSSGSRLARPTVAAGTGEHPLLVHFFNPSCPCSRFAAEQLATLEKRFRGRLDVLLVPLGDGAGSAGRALAHLPRTTAGALELAHRYGAYSTPTAVLLGADGTLLFAASTAPAGTASTPRASTCGSPSNGFWVRRNPTPSNSRCRRRLDVPCPSRLRKPARHEQRR